MEDWFRIEDDQEEPLTDRQKERILYAKIKNSKVLKPYLDKYAMMDEDDYDHSYHYLINSIDKYQQKTRKQNNLDDLAVAIIRKDTQHTGGRAPRAAPRVSPPTLLNSAGFTCHPLDVDRPTPAP